MKDFIDILKMIFDLQKKYNNEEIIDALEKFEKIALSANVTIKELVSLVWANEFSKWQ